MALVLAAVLVLAPPVGPIKLKSAVKGQHNASLELARFPDRTPVQKLANRLIQEGPRKAYQEFIKDAKEMFADKDYRPSSELEFEGSSTVSFSNPKLISFQINYYDYSGGAHPNHYCDGYTIGMLNGKPRKLAFADCFNPEAVRLVLADVNEQKKERGADPVEKLDPKLLDNFTVSKKGLSIVFSPYAIGAYAEGDYVAILPWSKIRPHLKGDALRPLIDIIDMRKK